jgi:mono/diheme cytochrome c family protein
MGRASMERRMTNLKVFAVVVVTIAIYTMLANAIPQVQSEVPEDISFGAGVTADQLVSAGETLYQGAGGCTACHGLGTRAPNLLTDEGGTGQIGARCALRIPGQDCKAYLHQSMIEPNTYVVEGYQPIMPDLRRTLSGAQIWALVAYLQSLGGEVTVTGDDVAADAEGGTAGGAAPAGAAGGALAGGSLDPRELLTAGTCLACHKLGDEGGPIGPSFDGMGGRIGADRIRRGILMPNADTADGFAAMAGTMPATFGEQYNAAQLEALVEFLAGLR